MKSVVYILFTVILSSFSYSGKGSLDDIIKLLNTGNATDATKHIDDNIEIVLPGKRNTYSRAQGIMVLKDFLNTNSVKHFEVQQKVENLSSSYCIGILYTRSGNYKATIFMINKQGRQLMREIRFMPT